MTRAGVAVLVVTFNSAPEVTACIQAARARQLEVVVIDNASSDLTRETATSAGARVLANASNLGFAAAVNRGVRETKAEFLLLLNPDAILESGIDALIEACGSSNVGAVGGKLMDAGGRVQKGFTVRRFPSSLALCLEALGVNAWWPDNPVNWHYRCFDLDLDQPCDVDQPAGAFLMFRREAWQKVGGFDEGFFPIWFEDVDFCKRLRDAGYNIQYIPLATARHTGAHSIARLSIGLRTKYWYCSFLRYSIRHLPRLGRSFTCLSVACGTVLRIVTGGKKHRTEEMLRIYAGVVGLAFRSLFVREVQFGDKVH